MGEAYEEWAGNEIARLAKELEEAKAKLAALENDLRLAKERGSGGSEAQPGGFEPFQDPYTGETLYRPRPPCGECGGSGTVEEDATGALGYVVKRPCPACARGCGSKLAILERPSAGRVRIIVKGGADCGKDEQAEVDEAWLRNALRRSEAQPETWMVTRTSSARYLGAYEWVRSPKWAAHFISREAADAAAKVATEGNGGVEVVPSPRSAAAMPARRCSTHHLYGPAAGCAACEKFNQPDGWTQEAWNEVAAAIPERYGAGNLGVLAKRMRDEFDALLDVAGAAAWVYERNDGMAHGITKLGETLLALEKRRAAAKDGT